MSLPSSLAPAACLAGTGRCPLHFLPFGSLVWKAEEMGSLSRSVFPSDGFSPFPSVSHASSPVKILPAACILSGLTANEGSNLPHLRASVSAARS